MERPISDWWDVAFYRDFSIRSDKLEPKVCLDVDFLALALRFRREARSDNWHAVSVDEAYRHQRMLMYG